MNNGPRTDGADLRRGRPPLMSRRKLQVIALRMFTERGFGATTTEQIAAEAGVSECTFFRYFTRRVRTRAGSRRSAPGSAAARSRLGSMRPAGAGSYRSAAWFLLPVSRMGPFVPSTVTAAPLLLPASCRAAGPPRPVGVVGSNERGPSRVGAVARRSRLSELVRAFRMVYWIARKLAHCARGVRQQLRWVPSG
jgi:AcrR family transcriptional regulator